MNPELSSGSLGTLREAAGKRGAVTWKVAARAQGDALRFSLCSRAGADRRASSGEHPGECHAALVASRTSIQARRPNMALQPTRAAGPNNQREPARRGPRG